MKLRLFHYWRSSSSWRVRWGLQLKRQECEFIAVNLLSDEPDAPDHLNRNPMGYVPVLEIVPSKQDTAAQTPTNQIHFLGESMAILEWLHEQFPNSGESFFPNDKLLRARSRQLAEIINSGTQPLQNLNVTQLHSENAQEQKKWNQFWICKGLQAYEDLVQETAGTFSLGEQVTLADLFLIPQCYNAKRNDIDLTAYPTIQRIEQAALNTSACQASAPERFDPGAK